MGQDHFSWADAGVRSPLCYLAGGTAPTGTLGHHHNVIIKPLSFTGLHSCPCFIRMPAHGMCTMVLSLQMGTLRLGVSKYFTPGHQCQKTQSLSPNRAAWGASCGGRDGCPPGLCSARPSQLDKGNPTWLAPEWSSEDCPRRLP